MKRIAIDCRPLMGDRAGIGRYLFELLREFSVRDDDVTFFLYAPGPVEVPDGCVNNPRFRIRIMRIRPAILWLHTIVPFWVLQDKIDVFWGPNYAVPVIRLRHYRSVITIHDATFARYPETMLWITRVHNEVMLPIYSKIADVILTDSRFSAGELSSSLGLLPERIHVVYLGHSFRSVPDRNDAVPAKSFILTTGTIEPRKNLETLVAAFAKLPPSLRQEYSLVVVGALGWRTATPYEWFDKHGVQNEAMYLGRVDDCTLSALYRNATAFVFPSLYEGFGLPVIEAMAAGCPVMCSYSSSLGEISGSAALHFDPNNVDDLANKLEALLSNPTLRNSLSDKAKNQTKQFSWTIAAAQTMIHMVGGGWNVDRA